MVEREDWRDGMPVTGLQHPPVVVERGTRELTLGRFDASPLDAESKCVHAEMREHCDVFFVTVIEVASVAGRLSAKGSLPVLPPPPIAVGVAALDLVGADGGAE